MVRLAGDHDADIHAGERRNPECIGDTLVRDEVGSLDIDRFPCGQDQFDVSFLDLAPPGVRTARDGLERAAPPARGIREVDRVVGKLFSRSIIPVHEEPELQPENTSPLDFYRCIPPVAERPFSQVLLPDIVAADVAGRSVDYGNLPVIPVVQGENPREEQGVFSAGLDKFFEVLLFQLHSHGICEQPDLHSLPCLPGQQPDQLLGERIIADDVVFEVDVMVRCPDGLKE